MFLEVNNTLNRKIRKIIKAKGKNSRAFWKLAKPREVEKSLNRVKKKDGTFTTSPEEALETVQEYFQELFSPRPRPSNKEPIKMPSIGWNKSLTRPFKLKIIQKCLKKLKENKVCGPDNIPFEVLTLFYAESNPTYFTRGGAYMPPLGNLL